MNYLETNNGDMTLAERENLDLWRIAWVAALRSDEYVQGHRALNRNSRMCCLGVLADLAVKAGHGVWKPLDGAYHSFRPIGRKRGDSLSVLLCDKNNIKLIDAWYGQLGVPVMNFETLANLNDISGYTFAKIADVIESRNVVLPNGAIL